MKDKLRRMRERWRGSEDLRKGVYIGCTVTAMVLSALILVSIAHGSRNMVEPPFASNAPDEGESLPLADPFDVVSSSPAASLIPIEMEISDSEASGLIAVALRDKMQTEKVEAHFSAPDNLTVSVEMTREALRDFLENEDTGIPGFLTVILPKSFTLSVGMGISADGSGSVKLEPREFEAFGLELTNFLPDFLVDMASDALNSVMPESTPIKDVEVHDGSATFTLEL